MKKLKFKQFIYTILYGLNPKNRPDFYIVTLITISILTYIKLSPEVSLVGIFTTKTNSDMLGLIVDGITVAVIISVWLSDLANDWKSQLEKYISVRFIYGKDVQIKDSYVRLSHESDIRSMAQSLGQAKNNGKRLPIKPSIRTLEKSVIHDNNGDKGINRGKPFCHYSVTIELTKDLTQSKEKEKEEKPNPELTFKYRVNDDVITIQQKENNR